MPYLLSFAIIAAMIGERVGCMFDWKGCPMELFDKYMEVGDVKAVASKDENCVCIEIWVGSGFAKTHVRPECGTIRRRPLYGILKQVEKLCAGRRTHLLFMCDDEECGFGNDTENWAGAIGLLLRELKRAGIVERTILFTRKSSEQIQSRTMGRFRREDDREEYIYLFRTLDVLITQQANRYASAEHRQIFARDEAWLAQARRLVDEG